MKERGLAPILIVLLVVGLIGAGIGAYIISQSGEQGAVFKFTSPPKVEMDDDDVFLSFFYATENIVSVRLIGPTGNKLGEFKVSSRREGRKFKLAAGPPIYNYKPPKPGTYKLLGIFENKIIDKENIILSSPKIRIKDYSSDWDYNVEEDKYELKKVSVTLVNNGDYPPEKEYLVYGQIAGRSFGFDTLYSSSYWLKPGETWISEDRSKFPESLWPILESKSSREYNVTIKVYEERGYEEKGELIVENIFHDSGP